MQYNSIDFFANVRLNGESHDQWQDFEEADIRNSSLSIHCPSCQAPIDRTGPGKWRALHPERTGLRGYHVPWYAFPNVDIIKLCLDSVSQLPTKRAEFYRSGLGVPYTESGSKITKDMLVNIAGQLPRMPIWSKTTIGIDVGTFYHYRVSSTAQDGLRYVRAMGKAKSLEEIDQIMRRYRVKNGVIDALPENHAVQTWVAKKRGRMLRAFFSRGLQDSMYRLDDQPASTTVVKGRIKKKLPKYTIHINRTLAMDMVYARIANEEEVWPADFTEDKDIVSQMCAPTRIDVQDKTTGEYFAQWVHTQPDHSFFGCLYDTIAQEIAPKGSTTILAQGKSNGWNP
jgi:hypothetical protein